MAKIQRIFVNEWIKKEWKSFKNEWNKSLRKVYLNGAYAVTDVTDVTDAVPYASTYASTYAGPYAGTYVTDAIHW